MGIKTELLIKFEKQIGRELNNEELVYFKQKGEEFHKKIEKYRNKPLGVKMESTKYVEYNKNAEYHDIVKEINNRNKKIKLFNLINNMHYGEK